MTTTRKPDPVTQPLAYAVAMTLDRDRAHADFLDNDICRCKDAGRANGLLAARSFLRRQVARAEAILDRRYGIA
jgi:hypothetical protein